MKNTYVICIGNPVEGFEFIGPFYDHIESEEYVKKYVDKICEWSMILLQRPCFGGEDE